MRENNGRARPIEAVTDSKRSARNSHLSLCLETVMPTKDNTSGTAPTYRLRK